MLQFAYTILYVNDVDASMRFYTEAFGLEIKFAAPGNTYGEMSTGHTTLSFASHTLAASNLKEGFEESSLQRKPFGIEIGFTTHDVAAAYERALKAGAKAEAAPATKPHGQTVAYVRDIDGFLVELCTPMS
jgi:lactoylglutathione lyase